MSLLRCYYIGSVGFGQQYLAHHGVAGMKWGVKHGPPYPLSNQASGVNKLMGELKGIRYKEFSTLMSPRETEKKRAGSCHDQTYFEASKLRELGITPKINFYIEADNKGQGGTTHSCVTFEQKGKTYWMENAWGGNEGLHRYSNYAQFSKDLKSRWDRKQEFPNLYSGTIRFEKLRPGMSLQQLLDVVEFD